MAQQMAIEEKPYPISMSAEYPEKMSRLTTFFRLLLVIPHIVVLYFVALAAIVVTFISWFAVLFTGRIPKGMFNFISGTLRWQTRVNGYTYLLTDKYPPFKLQ